MTFVTTWLAIAGLVGTSVPILIHLLMRRRRQPVQWGAMRLLVEAIRRHRRRARIEQILLLSIRCLILLFAGIALAQPVMSSILGSIGVGSRLLVLVVDDGLVSGIESDGPSSELDDSVDKARRVLDTLDPGDRVVLVSTAHPARLLTDGPTSNLEMVDRILVELRPSACRTDLAAALEIANMSIREHAGDSPATVSLIGSWREGSFVDPEAGGAAEAVSDIEWPVNTSLQLLASEPVIVPVTVVAVAGMSMRHPIESVRTERPPVRTTVFLERMGSDLPTSTSVVGLEGPGVDDSPPRQIEWSAGGSGVGVEFSGRSEPANAAVDGTSVAEGFIESGSIPAISRRSKIIDTSGTIRVGIVDRQSFSSEGDIDRVTPADWMERALRPGSIGIIEVDRIDPATLSAGSLRNIDAVIVARPDLLTEGGWTTVRDFADRGGFILFVPPSDMEAHPWLDIVSEEMDVRMDVSLGVVNPEETVDLALQQPGGSLLSNIDTEIDDLTSPVEVYRRLDVVPSSGDGTVLIRCSDGSPFLLVWEPVRSRQGTVCLFTSAPSLEWTNLPIKPLMVPLMQEMVREGASSGRRSKEIIAGDRATSSTGGIREFSGPGGRIVPSDRSGTSMEPLRDTGQWVARDAEGVALEMLVVNPEIDAGDPTLVSVDEFRSRLGIDDPWSITDIGLMIETMSRRENGGLWTTILLGAVLILVILETILNRRFSRAHAVPEGRTPGS